MNCVVLLSGGLDSTTILAHVARLEASISALSFRYGQRHEVEIAAAARAAAAYGARHLVIDIDLRVFGGSALTGDIAVPRDREPLDRAGEIPVTYVPARNTIFLSFATAFAEVLPANDIYIGVNAVDYSGYPDCRPEFIAAFERVANLGTRAGVTGESPIRIHAPLIGMTKGEIIRMGATLGVDYSGTVSCYDPTAEGLACGHCDSCVLRRRGFDEAGIADPTRYADS
jgi:7-cyano-7-deazaguanine synthase